MNLCVKRLMQGDAEDDDRDAVRLVLLTAAKLAGLRCDDKSTKVQIATKMLECWHPAALSNAGSDQKGAACNSRIQVPVDKKRGKSEHGVAGPDMNTDPLLQSVNRYAEHNKIRSIAIPVRGDQVAPAKGEAMHLGDAVEYWEKQADGDAKVWGAIVGFTFNRLSLELNVQRLYTLEETQHIFKNTVKVPAEQLKEVDAFFPRKTDRCQSFCSVALSDFTLPVAMSSLVRSRPLFLNSVSFEDFPCVRTSNTPLVYSSFLNTKKWTLHQIVLSSEDPDAVRALVSAHARYYRDCSALLRMGALATVSRHVNAGLRRVGKGGPITGNQCIFYIACPFALFCHMAYHAKECAVDWNKQARSWKAVCSSPDDLTPLLGEAWHTVYRSDQETTVRVDGEVIFVYSHALPDKIRFCMTKVITYGACPTDIVVEAKITDEPAVESAF
jgi:hypothetical protein